MTATATGHLRAIVGLEWKLAPELGDPLPFRYGPAHALQIDFAGATETNAFGLEEFALHVRAEDVAPIADPACRIDHALPWDDAVQRGRKHPQRLSNRTGRARMTQDRGDLPVRRDLPARYLPDDAVDEPMERRRAS